MVAPENIELFERYGVLLSLCNVASLCFCLRKNAVALQELNILWSNPCRKRVMVGTKRRMSRCQVSGSACMSALVRSWFLDGPPSMR